jgi:hypothetical protein
MSARITLTSLLLNFMTVMSALSVPAYANNTTSTAPISGFAHSFLMGMQLANAKITILETGATFRTNKNGEFGPFQYPVNKPITLQFEKWGYQTTQSATVIVPSDGLNDAYSNITFQIPSMESYYLLANIIGATIDENSCHLTATITAFHKTMGDVPQGEKDASVTISPKVNQMPFYFDIYESGPLKGKTNPFTRNLTKSSEDGGVAFFNLPPSDKPYILSAEKDGKKFSEATFICKKGAFINLSPPLGPTALKSE